MNAKKYNTRSKRSYLFPLKRFGSLYLMVAPVLVYFLVFTFYPLFLGLLQSLQENRILGSSSYVGDANYREVITDQIFWQAFRNSIIIGLGGLFITLISAIILSILLYEVRIKWLRQFIQTTTFLPFLFSWTVVGGIWVQILSNRGLVNGLLTVLGLSPIPFMSASHLARPIFMLTAAWKNAGYQVVLLTASLMAIDPNLYEASRIDGATRMRQIRHIMLPGMRGTIITLIVLGLTGLLRNFDQVYVMGNSAILPEVRTLLLYIFDQGISKFRVGTATAAATLVLLATLVMTILGTWLLRILGKRHSL